MKKFIDLPDDIRIGDKVLVTDSLTDPCHWMEQKYIGTFNNRVYSVQDDKDQCACGWNRAKLPEVNWNEIPIGTKVRFKDEGNDSYKFGFLDAVVNGVPYCTECYFSTFDVAKGRNNPTLYSYDYVELIEEEF